MAIEGTKRLTFTQQASRTKRFKVGGLISGRLALEVHGCKGFESRAENILRDGNLQAILATKGMEVRCFTPLGLEFNPAALIGVDGRVKTFEQIDAMASSIDALSQAAASRQLEYVFPQMLDVEGQTYKRIMIGELTDKEAAQLLKPEEVSGYHADDLQSRLKNPSGEALVYTNEGDANRYIQAANSQGRKFRFMTNAEFEALPAEVKSQLKGDNWFLVEISRGSNSFYWRSLRLADQDIFNPEIRCNAVAVRLVED